MNEKQIIAIKHLAKFMFLTSSQFVELKLYKNRCDVTNTLKVLLDAKRPLIGKKNFKPDPTYGKIESVYYLTKYGKNYLVNNFNYKNSEIKYIIKNINLFQNDYNHRKQTVDFYIKFNQWIAHKNGDITFCHYYFNKVGNNRSKDKTRHLYALNRIELKDGNSFIPDIITMFIVDDKKFLFLFEQHNGDSTNRLVKQLQSHLKSITEDVYEIHFGFKKSPRIVVICENLSVKNNTIKRLREDKQFDNFHNFFIFKSTDELQQNFDSNWFLINGEKVSFIQQKNKN